MRLAVSELEAFYAGPLGAVASAVVRDKLVQAWDQAARLRVVGFGYAGPFLSAFTESERRIALCPEGTGVRAGCETPSVLVHDHRWPLPDASVDRLLIVHGLEEVSGPRRLLREAWRVLADDGLMIIVAANRRGLWSLLETSPFAAGRPYTRRQLDRLLEESMFAPTAHAIALHFPPIESAGFLRLARTWERMGNSLESLVVRGLYPNFAGLNLVEARKSAAIPISGSKAEVFRPGLLIPQGLRPASNRQGRDRTNNASSANKFEKPGRSA